MLWILAALTCLSILGLMLSYHSNPTRLMNGFLFTLSLIFLFITLIFFALAFNVKVLTLTLIILFSGLLLLFLFLYYFQAILWLWNAWIVWHRENHSLSNNLTLIIGILALVMFFIYGTIEKFTFITTLINLLVIYALFCVFSFTSSALLFKLRRAKPNKRFIIVLGAGLLNGDQVSPLLASRIDRGISFFNKVKTVSGFEPLLICSGGKGGDETIPEGEAMRNYAIQHGVNPKRVIAEKRSKNTLENMLYSKKIVEQNNLPDNSGVYVSSDYHIFRAGIYAQQAGLKIPGLGSKTSHFFIPNAIIREYAALMLSHKRFHLIMIGLIFILSLILTGASR